MLGNYSKKLDDKKRVIIPQKLRERLGNPFYVTLGPDNVLEIRNAKTFLTFQEKLLANNMLNLNARNFARLLLGNTYELSYDDQGRTIFPESLLDILEITTEITFVGVGNKIEIWNPESYKKFLNANCGKNSLEQIAKKMLKDGANY